MELKKTDMKFVFFLLISLENDFATIKTCSIKLKQLWTKEQKDRNKQGIERNKFSKKLNYSDKLTAGKK